MRIEHIENICDLYRVIREFGGGYPIYIRRNKPLKRIFSLLERQREDADEECMSIIITEDYQDQEWSQEYEEYYRNMFIANREGITNTAIKLDFFVGRINNISELSNFDNNKFLGYMILRPLPTQRVCESVIKVPTEIDRRNYFVICKTAFVSEIGDHQFEIKGFPFVQQEIITGVCAHACLRMISLYLARKYGTPRLSIPRINDISEEVPVDSPTMSNISAGGLWTPHVHRVFREMNCQFLIYNFTREEKPPYQPNELIYPYMESGLPVFVGFQTETTGHSVVVIGHTFDPNSWWPEAKSGYYRHPLPPRPLCLKSISWTDFILQDDNFGPYLTMPRDFPFITAVAVPIPRSILLVIPVEDAEAIAYSYISDNQITKIALSLRENMEETEKRWIEMYYHHLIEGKLVLRTFLIEKEEINNFTNRDDIPSKLQEVYSLLKIPDRVWFTEISVPELFSHKRSCLGEVIIDPTCPINIFGSNKAIISMHLPGIIFCNDPEREEFLPITIRVENDAPYGHMIRS